MNWKFGKRSEEKLATVHRELSSVARKALELSPVDFGVTEGFAIGATKTLKSKHLTGRAIDIACFVDGKITWELEYYQIVANAFDLSRKELDIDLRWGGSWHVNDFALREENKFIDAVHFELVD